MSLLGQAETSEVGLAVNDLPPFKIHIAENLSFIGDGFSGLQVVDVTNREALRALVSVDLPGYS
jgi:hypothetical protein